jgi:chaperone modulatory protein CbpM
MTFDEIVAACRVRRVELRRWVEYGWLLPVEVEGGWEFGEIDLARARLIRDLRRDLGVNEAAVPLILDLIDQREALERRLCALVRELHGEAEETCLKVLDRWLGGGSR